MLTLVFVAPLLLWFARSPRPTSLLFIGLLGGTAFLAIQALQRSGQHARIRTYLIVLYLLLSSRMIGVGPNAPARHYIFYYSFTLVLIAVLSLSGRYAWLLKVPAAAAGLFSLVVGLVFFAHATTTASLIHEEILNAIYQTDLYEALGYVETFIGLKAVPLLFAFVFVPAWMLLRSTRRPIPKLPRGRHTVILGLILLLTWETRAASNEYLVMSSALQYHAAMQRHRAVVQRRAALTDTRGAIEANLTRQVAETHVIVIGEATSRYHMGLYGYFRDTTPNLSRLAKSLVILTDAIASDRFTQPVLARALTAANVDDHPDYRPASAYSLIDVLRAAGLRVYWLSNQSAVGFWDTHVSLLSEGADRRLFLSASLRRETSNVSRPDEVLFPAVRGVLDERGEAKVIFVHLMGTHLPYKRRYPQRFARYRDSVPLGALGGAEIDPKLTARINQYDNAVLYNDYVVSTFIEDLRERGGLSSLMYFSDHGETPGGTTRGQRFSPGQVEIPVLFWFSDQFREAHAGLIQILTANRHKRFMSDHLFDVALDLVGVESKIYSPQRSLFRREFVERNRKTLSGKLDYDSYPDPIIMARNNMARLGATLPHFTQKVYSWSGPDLSSLGQAIGLFAGVALNLVFNEERDTFDIAQSAPGARMTLRHVLEFLRSNGSDAKLLFRLGNLSGSNAAQAVADLIKLEEEYRFGERATLVVPDVGEHLHSLAQAGLKIMFMTAQSGAIVSSHTDGSHRDLPEGTMAVSLRPVDSIVVERDVDPSDSAFVESMSTLSEADAARAIVIVVPALSKFEQHF